MLGRTKLIICFWSTLPSEIDRATRLFVFNFFSKLSLNINFTIVYDCYYAYFPRFYTYLIALLFACLYISCHIYDYLSVCLSVFTWQKIDQAGGPETFFNFVWPNASFNIYNIKKIKLKAT